MTRDLLRESVARLECSPEGWASEAQRQLAKRIRAYLDETHGEPFAEEHNSRTSVEWMERYHALQACLPDHIYGLIAEPQPEPEYVWRVTWVVNYADLSSSEDFVREKNARDVAAEFEASPAVKSVTIERAQIGPWDRVGPNGERK